MSPAELLREPVKKIKMRKIPHFLYIKKKQVVFKMHFKPFEGILGHVFFQLFWVGTPPPDKKNWKFDTLFAVEGGAVQK